MKALLLLNFLIALVIFTGCRSKPEGIMPLDQFKVVFLHHMVAEEMANNYIARDTSYNFDSARAALFNGVLQLNHTDSATFIRSVNYYKADPERFGEMLDSVNALAGREKEAHSLKMAAALKKKATADSIARADSLKKIKKATASPAPPDTGKNAKPAKKP